MSDLFYRGEPLYMSILTLLLFAIIMMSITLSIFIFRDKVSNVDHIRQHISYLNSIGLFTLIFGLFTQLLGLYGAFIAIKEWGRVSSSVLSTGLWTSSIPSLYGLLIFLFTHLMRQGLTAWLNRVTTS